MDLPRKIRSASLIIVKVSRGVVGSRHFFQINGSSRGEVRGTDRIVHILEFKDISTGVGLTSNLRDSPMSIRLKSRTAPVLHRVEWMKC